MEEIDEPILVISGPTASAKSQVAVHIAKTLNTEIVNIDSVQLYRDCAIGSAQLTKAEQQGIKHHLLACFDPSEKLNAYRYLVEAKRVIAELREQGKTPLFVGGTTLYIKLLVEGLDIVVGSNQELRSELDLKTTEELYELLRVSDPEALSTIHTNDRVRVIRALELSQSKSTASESKVTGNRALILVLCWERELLYQRINSRAKAMLEQGLVEETQSLIEKWGSDATPLSSIGYVQSVNYLKGAISKSELETELAKVTRNFAKRQINFWRNEPIKCNWQTRTSNYLVEQSAKKSRSSNSQKDLVGELLDYSELIDLLSDFIKKNRDFQSSAWFVDAQRLFQTIV